MKMIGVTRLESQAILDSGTVSSGSLGGLQIRNLLTSSTVHQRIMSDGREPLVEAGGGVPAHTFSLDQRSGKERRRRVRPSCSPSRDTTST